MRRNCFFKQYKSYTGYIYTITGSYNQHPSTFPPPPPRHNGRYCIH